jgi:excisionase family DNA binding protein
MSATANTTAPPWLSIPEAAAHARVSIATVERWLRSKILARHRPAGARRVLISAEELDRLITAGAAR